MRRGAGDHRFDLQLNIPMTTAGRPELRALPSVDEVLRRPEVQRLATENGHAAVVQAVREVLKVLRTDVSGASLDAAAVEQESTFFLRRSNSICRNCWLTLCVRSSMQPA